jgi:hypothetical protein
MASAPLGRVSLVPDAPPFTEGVYKALPKSQLTARLAGSDLSVENRIYLQIVGIPLDQG